jgi:hypothetical protein
VSNTTLEDSLVKYGVSAQLAKGFVNANGITGPYIGTATILQTPPPAPAKPTNNKGTLAGANTPQGPYIGTIDLMPNLPGPGGSTGGGSGDGSSPSDGKPPLDWRAYLADWGFDQDVVDGLDKIFRTYTNVDQAQAAALAYIRGTQWYARTFPGIGAGIKAGLIGDEAGYRAYVNQLNQVYRRYYNRDVTSQEVADALGRGVTSGAIDSHLQGQAYIAANKGDIQYQLGAFDENGPATEAELSAYGDQLAGLSNMIGPQLQNRLDKARARLQAIMQGSLAAPSFRLLDSGRLATASGTGKPDVGA